ncbi:MAG TPA: ribosomal L7Ae/L30e/S12e/Gadd45 family protein [Oscillospiraceae bacterium]|nr:ribosomal L7Ae/L30e/S12e/Gadd45 family protein [Oscillospiraceae bacterium]HPS34179.1 ribosomal L7Ae/L30e/S12e/Gadd45 family protein [Oscillospiraceae bacterium]
MADKNQDKLMTTMGLAKKAGRLVYGYETVKDAIQKHKAVLVLTAADLSAKTLSNVEFLCRESVRHVMTGRTMEQFSSAVGKPTGVAAVTDEGFAKLISGYLTDTHK